MSFFFRNLLSKNKSRKPATIKSMLKQVKTCRLQEKRNSKASCSQSQEPVQLIFIYLLVDNLLSKSCYLFCTLVFIGTKARDDTDIQLHAHQLGSLIRLEESGSNLKAIMSTNFGPIFTTNKAECHGVFPSGFILRHVG